MDKVEADAKPKTVVVGIGGIVPRFNLFEELSKIDLNIDIKIDPPVPRFVGYATVDGPSLTKVTYR